MVNISYTQAKTVLYGLFDLYKSLCYTLEHLKNLLEISQIYGNFRPNY